MKEKTCTECFGKGTVPSKERKSDMNDERTKDYVTFKCPTCKGTGSIMDEEKLRSVICPSCLGKGEQTTHYNKEVEKELEEDLKKQVKPGKFLEHPCTKPPFEAVKPVSSAYSTQVGGSHYKDMAIQPGKYCQANRLPFYESNVIKMVSRHRNKGGKQDIEKAIHYLQLLIEEEYNDNQQPKE